MRYKKSGSIALALCAAAGILYNSWPLGYWLDNQTARHGLASDLEKAGHPYYWLFILGDILTALCTVAAGSLVWFAGRREPLSRAWQAVAIGLVVFGLFTAASALVPTECSGTTLAGCGSHDGQGLGFDGLFSTIAALGLFMSLVGAARLGTPPKLDVALARIVRITAIAWWASGVIFIILALTDKSALLPEDILLALSGLALAAIGLVIDKTIP